MIIRILNSPRSVITSYLYNQNKVYQGAASILKTNCMPSNEPMDMEMTFMAREDNPDIDNRAKKLGLHIAISPGPDEMMDDDKAKRLAEEYMEDMGYNDQPWILYKHEDIERVHYHIVASKVKKNGTLIYDSYTGLKTKKFIKEKGEEYGFVLGKNKLQNTEKKIYLKRFTYTKGDIVSQMKHFYKKSLKYNYSSVEDFLMVMRAFGIRTDIRQDNSMGFIGMDKYGNLQGNYIGNIDKLSYQEIKKGIKQDKEKRKIDDCSEIVESCLIVCANEKEFLKELKKANIDCFIVRDKSNNVEDMIFIDHLNESVFHLDDFSEKLSIENVKLITEDWEEPITSSLAANSRETNGLSDLLDRMIKDNFLKLRI